LVGRTSNQEQEDTRMRPIHRSSLFRVICLISVYSISSVAQNLNEQKRDDLKTGTVESVVKHADGRVIDMIWPLTPIYDNYPYYDITIKAPDHTYMVRYESMGGYYPSGWNPGKEVKFLKGKGTLELLRYDGELVSARILN